MYEITNQVIINFNNYIGYSKVITKFVTVYYLPRNYAEIMIKYFDRGKGWA